MGRDIWVKRVERRRDSGLTAKEFAAEIGVNANTLSQWRWRLAKEARECEAGNQPPRFVEVIGTSSAKLTRGGEPPPEPLEVVLPSGVRIRVTAAFDAATLRRVVATLVDG